MKIIFLDIDGVLAVNHQQRDEFGSLFHEPFVENLREIVEATQAKIVISSSWRKSGWGEMKAMWAHRNMPGELIDITPSITLKRGMIGFYRDKTEQQLKEYGGMSLPRGIEIESWLNEEGGFQRINWSIEEQIKRIENAKVKNYVILDDDSDFLYCQREHYVQCSLQRDSDSVEGLGLTDRAAQKAIDILNSDPVQLYYGKNQGEHEPIKDMDAICDAIKHADVYGLRAEVLLWSLYAIQANPKLTVLEALECGLDEWDV